MKRNLQMGAAVLGMVVMAAFAERRVLIKERARHGELQAEFAGATHTNRAPAPIVGLTSEAQAALRALPRLRNEVRQLRDSIAELPGLREERARLAAQLADAASKPKVAEPTPEAGFVMNTSWTFAGLGTPEATLQSFFAAIRDSNVVNLIACLPPEVGAAGNTQERMHQTQSELMRSAEGFRRVAGYRVVATEPAGDNRVILKVQAAANGITAAMPLRRINGEWKMDWGRD